MPLAGGWNCRFMATTRSLSRGRSWAPIPRSPAGWTVARLCRASPMSTPCALSRRSPNNRRAGLVTMATPCPHPDRSAAFARVCDAGVHCATCRDPAEREWRASLCAVLRCPDGAPDFACPRGKPWGGRPDPARASGALQHPSADSPATGAAGVAEAAAPDTTAALAGKRAADLLSARLAVCHSCDEFNGATCERRFPRGCCLSSWQAWLAAKASRCPHAAGPKWPTDGPAGRDSVHPLPRT